MEDVISKLSEIEATASNIMKEVASRKKELSDEMDEKIKAFDVLIDTQTSKQLQQIQKDLEVEKEKRLFHQQASTDSVIARMEHYYNENHTMLAKQVYDKLLRM